ncbi:MAG: hypothetical protein ACUVRS_12715 [Armatimonadota bacterium]
MSKILLQWVKKGFWAVADQGLFSGANFLANILLARWLSPTEYGAFAVAYSAFLFISGFHNALVLEPMLILGPANHKENIESYFGQVLWVHTGLCVFFAALGVIISSLTIGVQLREALLGISLNLPFILSVWLIRSMFYVKQYQQGSFATSIIYALVLNGVVIVLQQLDCLSLTSACLAFGISGVACITYSSFIPRLSGMRNLQVIVREHWNYGRWLVPVAALSFGIYQVQTFVVAGILGLEVVGALRAMLNFILPMTQMVTAIGLLVIPVLSREYGDGNLKAVHFKARMATGGLVTIALFYEFCLIVLANPLEQLLYGGKYRQEVWLLPIVGLIAVFTALTSGYSFTLRAIQRPQQYLITTMAPALVGLISTIALTWWWGLAGAAVSTVGVYVVSLASIYFIYRKWFLQRYISSQVGIGILEHRS